MILFLWRSSTKNIIQNVLGGNTVIINHVDHSSVHRARTANVVLDILGGFAVFQIGVVP